MEGKKFQIKTTRKLEGTTAIKWSLRGIGSFRVDKDKIRVDKCNGGYVMKGNEGFLQKAGVLTLLKTNTQLQIWFDDVLEVTWVYEDDNDEKLCTMRNTMTGLRFRIARGKKHKDTVSTHYRYELGGNRKLNFEHFTVVS